MATLYEQWAAEKGIQMPQRRSQPLSPQKKDEKSILTDQISTGGGIAGALAGGAGGAAIGSVVPGVGTAIGGLLGALIGGAAGSGGGEYAENVITEEEDPWKNVGTEALIGGATSLPIGAGLKVARAGVKAAGAPGKKSARQLLTEAGESTVGRRGAKQSTSITQPGSQEAIASTPLRTSRRGRLADRGNRLLESQYGTISKQVAEETKPRKTIGSLADIGITKPQDAERIASAVTGANGLLNRRVAEAVGSSRRVDTGGLERVLDDAMKNQGIVDSEAKSLLSTSKAKLGKLRGGAEPSIDASANPLDALDVMRDLEKRASQLKRTDRMGNRTDQANALLLMKDEIADRLYGAAGADANISKILTPKLRDDLLALNPGNKQWENFVKNKVMKSKSVADLRSAQAPFVNISKIIDEADTNAMTFGGRVPSSLGSGAGVKQAALEAGVNAVKEPVSRVAGSAMRRLGSMGPTPGGLVDNAARQGGQSIPGVVARQGAGRLGASAFGAYEQEPTTDMATLEGALSAGGGLGMGADASMMGQEAPMQETTNPFGLSLDQVAQAIPQAMAAGDSAAVEELTQLYGLIEDYEVSQAPSSKPLGAEQQKAVNNARSGLQSLDELEQILASDPSMAWKSSLPGGGLTDNLLGASTYEALRNNVMDAMTRLRSGANMTEGETERFSAMLPRAGDTEETIQRKLQTFRDYFNMAANQGSSDAAMMAQPGSLEEALVY